MNALQPVVALAMMAIIVLTVEYQIGLCDVMLTKSVVVPVMGYGSNWL
jgi:hypothetical protein